MRLTIDCPLAIPLLLGLWAEADDSGIFEWKPLTLKVRILPAANCDIDDLISTLVRNDFVRTYEVGGKSYGAIRNFVIYQRPKEPKSTFPASDEMLIYAGFRNGERPRSELGRPPGRPAKRTSSSNKSDTCGGSLSEPVSNDFGSTSEENSQMKDVGCRRKGEEKKEDLTSLVDPRLVRLKTGITSAFLDARSMTLNPDTARAAVWLAQGYDPDLCLAVVRDVLGRKPNVSTLNYFDSAIAKTHAERAPPRPATTAKDQKYSLGAVRWPESAIVNALKIWDEKGVWMDNIGPAPNHPDCQVPKFILDRRRDAAIDAKGKLEAILGKVRAGPTPTVHLFCEPASSSISSFERQR